MKSSLSSDKALSKPISQNSTLHHQGKTSSPVHNKAYFYSHEDTFGSCFTEDRLLDLVLFVPSVWEAPLKKTSVLPLHCLGQSGEHPGELLQMYFFNWSRRCTLCHMSTRRNMWNLENFLNSGDVDLLKPPKLVKENISAAASRSHSSLFSVSTNDMSQSLLA